MAADVLATAQERLAIRPNPGGLEAARTIPILEAPANRHGNQMATATDFGKKRDLAGEAKSRMK
jgi:hypothetical protein